MNPLGPTLSDSARQRIPSALTLELVRAMATDPTSTKALRAFHARNLVELERRADATARDQCARQAPRQSPFSRFIEALETETPNQTNQ